MDIVKNIGWTYYIEKDNNYDSSKVGKWMLFFNFDNELDFFEGICKDVVEKKILKQSKCSSSKNNRGQGVAIFYLNIDDMETHKKIISYFIENNLIPRTKNGRLYNISFKLDDQTREGQYNDDFISQLKLDKIIDLNTEKFLY